MLPDGFIYKMLRVIQYRDMQSFHCTFKLEIDTEEKVRKWLAAYNEKSKETMVYESCRNSKGKRVVTCDVNGKLESILNFLHL